MSDDRVLHLQGVHNFRDFGGYRLSGGGRLKRGLLWRSGQHYGATDADVEKIAALGLASVFDLRSSKERTAHPCRRPVGFAAAIHFADDPATAKAAGAAPHLAAARLMQQRTPEAAREGLLRNYDGIAFRPELVRMMRLYLAELAEGKGASLINCMAGKDRTGISVAALQLTVGMHKDDVIEDYVLTNTAGDAEARIAAGMAAITAITGRIDEAVLRVIMGVEPEYLEAAFAAMAERHGSIDGYLREVLGVDEPLRERLREALVEASSSS